MRLQRGKIRLAHQMRAGRHLDGKVQHGFLPLTDVRLAVVDRHLVGNQRVFGANAQNCPMRHHAILALIQIAGGDHNHLALGLAQLAGLVHQRVVVGKKGAKLIRPVRQGEKHIRDKTGFFLHGQDARAQVFGQGVQFRHGKTADGRGEVSTHDKLLKNKKYLCPAG